MKSYLNNFLKISAFPDKNWKIVSPQTSKIKKSEAHLYQINDEEMPIYEGQLKRLFLLKLPQKGKPKIIDCEIELSILKEHKNSLAANYELFGSNKVFAGQTKIDTENGSIWYFLSSPFIPGYWYYLRITVFRDIMRDTVIQLLGQLFLRPQNQPCFWEKDLKMPWLQPMAIHYFWLCPLKNQN
jgi:hypothetical protein